MTDFTVQNMSARYQRRVQKMEYPNSSLQWECMNAITDAVDNRCARTLFIKRYYTTLELSELHKMRKLLKDRGFHCVEHPNVHADRTLWDILRRRTPMIYQLEISGWAS